MLVAVASHQHQPIQYDSHIKKVSDERLSHLLSRSLWFFSKRITFSHSSTQNATRRRLRRKGILDL